jgi:hypothetical protein
MAVIPGKYQPLGKPVLFGVIAPVGTGDANALRITSNLETEGGTIPYPYGNPNSQDDLWVNKLEIKANAGNGGRIFVCWGVSPFNEATTFINGGGATPVLGGVIRAIDAGESWSIGDSQKADVYWAGMFQIVIEDAGDYCHALGDVL